MQDFDLFVGAHVQAAAAQLGLLEEQARRGVAHRAVAAPLARGDAQAVDHAAHALHRAGELEGKLLGRHVGHLPFQGDGAVRTLDPDWMAMKVDSAFALQGGVDLLADGISLHVYGLLSGWSDFRRRGSGGSQA